MCFVNIARSKQHIITAKHRKKKNTRQHKHKSQTTRQHVPSFAPPCCRCTQSHMQKSYAKASSRPRRCKATQHNTTQRTMQSLLPAPCPKRPPSRPSAKKPIIPPRPPLFSHPAEMKPLHNPMKSLHSPAKTARPEQTQPARHIHTGPAPIKQPHSSSHRQLTSPSHPLHQGGTPARRQKYCRPKKTFRRSRTHRPPRKSSIKQPSAAHSFELFSFLLHVDNTSVSAHPTAHSPTTATPILTIFAGESFL